MLKARQLAVSVLDSDTPTATPPIPVTGAHGAEVHRISKRFCTTNIAGGRLDELVGIDTNPDSIVGA